MPKQVDHEQRREEIAAALWRVVGRDGIEAATVRQVAAEAGVSAGRVQHYFSTKEQMLRFALQQVGEQLATRLAERIAGLGPSAPAREVVRAILVERIPARPADRVYVQALLAWLGQATADPELADYMVQGHRALRDRLADRLGGAQRAGDVPAGIDPARTADGLLAATDGLISHVLQGIHDPDAAIAVLDEYLSRVFPNEGDPGQPAIV